MKTFFLFAMALILVSVATFVSADSSSKYISPATLTPKDTANIQIEFDGLMALCFGNPEKASIGILNVPHHTPELKVTRIDHGKRSTALYLKGNDLHTTYHFDVEGREQNIRRYTGVSMKDVNDFRWTLDMESDLFQKKLYVQEDKLWGKIHFNAGLFYSINLSKEKYRFVANDSTNTMLPFNRQVADPAAMLNLADGESLVISNDKEVLRLKAEDGVSYQITIHNLPPAEMADMNHFLFYFTVMGEKITPYRPLEMAKAAFTPRPLICGAAVFSQSKLD